MGKELTDIRRMLKLKCNSDLTLISAERPTKTMNGHLRIRGKHGFKGVFLTKVSERLTETNTVWGINENGELLIWEKE
jgi:hypothetical protein